MQQELPPTLGALFSRLLAQFLSSWTGRAVAAIFIALQIYLMAIIPAWQQGATLPGAWAKLENAQREADVARQRQAGEAHRIAEEAKLKRAEADAVLVKAKGDADTREAEADRAIAEAVAAPALEKAIADEAAARAKVLIGTASAAHDLARNEADRVEAQARETYAKSQTAVTTLAAKAATAKARTLIIQEALLRLIGPPLPEIFSLESDK